MSLIENLGYEQLRALAILNKTPNIEGTELCSQADCSWLEMFQLHERGLIDKGENRVQDKRLHPIITEQGKLALQEALEHIPELALR